VIIGIHPEKKAFKYKTFKNENGTVHYWMKDDKKETLLFVHL
jgi:hypothetical protein